MSCSVQYVSELIPLLVMKIDHSNLWHCKMIPFTSHSCNIGGFSFCRWDLCSVQIAPFPFSLPYWVDPVLTLIRSAASRKVFFALSCSTLYVPVKHLSMLVYDILAQTARFDSVYFFLLNPPAQRPFTITSYLYLPRGSYKRSMKVVGQCGLNKRTSNFNREIVLKYIRRVFHKSGRQVV